MFGTEREKGKVGEKEHDLSAIVSHFPPTSLW